MTSLSIQLKQETHLAHQQAEQHPWVLNLLQGTLALPQYVAYLQLLEPVYLKMEQFLAQHTVFYTLLATLKRSSQLQKDLRLLNQMLDEPPQRLESRYSQHWDLFSANQTHLLIAHFYVRYFGDLQGGAIITKHLIKHLNLNHSQLNFYDFTDFKRLHPEPISFLRATIDAIALSESQRMAVIEESKRAFFYSEHLMSQALL